MTIKRVFRKGLFAATFCLVGFSLGQLSSPSLSGGSITHSMVSHAAELIGLSFTSKEQSLMFNGLEQQRAAYQALRRVSLPNHLPPAIIFRPWTKVRLIPGTGRSARMNRPRRVRLPSSHEDLAFYSVGQLAELIRSRKITSAELTRLYLGRLKRHGERLECLVTLLEETGLREARLADAEIAAGRYRGPLHGIPFGVKDLLATKGVRTTWGSKAHQSQVIEEDATVIKRLRQAGAVLIAKLSLGALGWGDVWFGGQTRNPWNLEQGSSGSSSGPAGATAAGLVTFSIGTETWGSIVSPATRCGVTGLRPTFGRVSRAGAMTLSWSMDKIGPICRTVEDCALVFDAIHGWDGLDTTVQEAPFDYPLGVDFAQLKVGYLKTEFAREKEDAFRLDPEELQTSRANDMASLEALRVLGAGLIPIELPDLPVQELSIILNAEAAAAFDEFVRSGKVDLLRRQTERAWPNVFRRSRLIPAVEYIQANRIRRLLMEVLEEILTRVDLYVAPSVEGQNLLLTNLTGHPCVVVPNGFSRIGTPTSISFTGRLFDEGRLLAFAKSYQEATGFHLRHPPFP